MNAVTADEKCINAGTILYGKEPRMEAKGKNLKRRDKSGRNRYYVIYLRGNKFENLITGTSRNRNRNRDSSDTIEKIQGTNMTLLTR